MLNCDHDADAGLSLPELLELAAADGVRFSITNSNTVRVDGDAAALLRWLPAIRARRVLILQSFERPPQWRYEVKA